MRAVLFGMLLLALAACSRPEIIIVEGDERERANAPDVPFARSADPRVHPAGKHHPAPTVQIGPEEHDTASAYVPIAASDSPLLRTTPAHEPYRPVLLAHERARQPEASHPVRPTASPNAIQTASNPRAAQTPTTVQAQQGVRPAGPPSATTTAAQPSAEPTMPARYTLGTSLGTPAPAAGPSLSMGVAGDEPEVVSGPIESVNGSTVTVRTVTGSRRVQLPEQARLEREGRGRIEDVRPGEVVGVVMAPGGPATTIRLYSKGQGMPRPGVVPMVGAQLGQVTTFGTVIALQAGGLLVNAGGANMPIPMSGGVEVLKPAQAAARDLTVGASVTATGLPGPEGVLVASSIRLTSEGSLAR